VIQGAQTLAYSQGASQTTPPAAYQRPSEAPRTRTRDVESVFGSKFWAEFLRDALAAIAGAGVGSWLGALAVFTLAQIYNDLLVYERQFMVPANSSDAPWFWLVPSGITEEKSRSTSG
jgi:hypothetical protein